MSTTDERLSAALEYLDYGLSVIPVQQENKKPYINWLEFQTRHASMEEVESWWQRWPEANVAIVTGAISKIVVADADGPKGLENLKQMLASSPRQQKTGKGAHYFFKHPGGHISNRGRIAEELDIRGDGGYVVVAPSVHSNGTQYEWILFPGSDWDELPVYQLRDTRRQQAPAAGNLSLNLSQVKVSPSEKPQQQGNRNNHAAALVGRYLREGKSLEECMLFLRGWNMENQPPLDDAELLAIVNSVGRTHARNTGSAPSIEPSLPPAGCDALLSLGIVSWGQAEDNPAPMPKELWGPRILIEGGRLLIAGAPKVGKTDYLQSLAMAAAVGGKFLDWTFTKPVTTLYLQAELLRPYFEERIRNKLTQTNPNDINLIRQNLHFSGRLYRDLLNGGDCDLLAEALQQLRPGLLIIDPVVNFSTADETNNTEITQLLNNVNWLAESVNAAVVLAHHVSKSTMDHDEPFKAIRGAGAFRGWYDSGVMLWRDKDQIMTAYELRYGASLPVSGLIPAYEGGEWQHQTFQNSKGADKEPVIRMDDPRIATALEILAGFPAGLTAGEWNEKVKRHFSVSDRTAKVIRLKAIEHAGIEGVGDGTTKLYRYDRRKAG